MAQLGAKSYRGFRERKKLWKITLKGKKALVNASQTAPLISGLEVTLKHIHEMIAPEFPLVLKSGSALTQQQETIALGACDQLHELFSIKASKKDIAKAIRMLSCG